MKTFLSSITSVLAVGAAALLVACGGGGGGDAGPTAPEAVHQGTIDGFGSVIVNGVRFDDSRARVQLDDDPVVSSALRLGMRAEVHGSVSDDGARGSASSVSVDTSVRGAITSVDVAQNRLQIRAITVQVDDTTVFEGASGLSGLKAGDWVEVHGSVDFEHRTVQATRIEVKAAAEDIGRAVFFGQAATATADRFVLGDLVVDYSHARLIGFDGATVPEGALVRVRSQTAPVGNVLTATVVKAVKAPRFQDGTPAAVEGRVQRFTSVADFFVSGTAVDASNARFEHGSAADLAEGRRVVVTGQLANGKLVAKKVRLYRGDLDGEIRLIGTVTDYLSSASFKVRGVAVDASAAEFVRGDASQLANGRVVEIRGESAGSVVKATRVEFEEHSADHVLTGIVTDLAGTGFRVAGQAVTLAADVRYVNGTAADLVAGARVWLVGDRSATAFTARVVIFVPGPTINPVRAAGTVEEVAADFSFKLNGTLVTTSASTDFKHGDRADLKAGAWVAVTGRVTNGVLAADEIVFARQGDDACQDFKFEGVVYDFVAVGNFKVMGFTIDGTGARFEGGTAAQLANGRAIEVCGDALPVDGVATAAKIEFKTSR